MTCNLRTGHGHGQNPLLNFVSLVISLEYVKLDVTNLVWRLLVENTIVSVIEYCTTECAQDHMTPPTFWQIHFIDISKTVPNRDTVTSKD